MMTDIEIANSVEAKPIGKIADRLGIPHDALIPYGRDKAKIDVKKLPAGAKKGKLILVTAISPTPAGEGKTTISVGLADSLSAAGKNTIVALREPSLGPVFGVKGGAAGGGWSQVIPMEDINLHFTGDIHAVSAANNLMCAMLDNHIFQGNRLGIDKDRIVIKRCVDMNDRQLRNITDGLGGEKSGVPRSDGFVISVATEMMAILCLSKDIEDLKNRVARCVLAYTTDGRPVTAGDIRAEGAVAALMRDAIRPNLVQTLEGTPAIIHGGPFANIAHGCNSIAATNAALSLADLVVTEAGFGSDLGAEKFFDIKCRMNSLEPACVVLVATVRALKYQGGVPVAELKKEDTGALAAGIGNLGRHIDNLTGVFGRRVVVALNVMPSDTDAEKEFIRAYCAEKGVDFAPALVFAKGSAGGGELADKVISVCEREYTPLTHPYELSDGIASKIEAVATKVYHADGVDFSEKALASIADAERLGFGGMPVCIAKTQYSFSDDPKKLGAPEDFRLSVSDVSVSAGAGFIVAYTGKIMTMPGLPPVPAAEKIDVDADGNISGLF